jgi:hypothetical protein
MAIDIGTWLSSGGGEPTAQAATRAGLAWRRIQDKKTSVAFRTPAGSTLSAQDVRIESDSGNSMSSSPAGAAGTRRIVIFGIRGHATESYTVIAEGYRCVIAGDEYRVQSIVLTIGEVQAFAEAVSG